MDKGTRKEMDLFGEATTEDEFIRGIEEQYQIQMDSFYTEDDFDYYIDVSNPIEMNLVKEYLKEHYWQDTIV